MLHNTKHSGGKHVQYLHKGCLLSTKNNPENKLMENDLERWQQKAFVKYFLSYREAEWKQGVQDVSTSEEQVIVDKWHQLESVDDIETRCRASAS